MFGGEQQWGHYSVAPEVGPGNSSFFITTWSSNDHYNGAPGGQMVTGEQAQGLGHKGLAGTEKVDGV